VQNMITLSVADAARLTGLSEWTIRDLVYRGVVDARRHGRRVLVLAASLREYIAELDPIA